MVTRLRALVTRIALVEHGANRDATSGEGAHVVLWKSDPPPNPGVRTTEREEASPMSRIATIVKQLDGLDRDAVYARIEEVSRDEFPDLPRAQAVVKVLDRFPELHERYYAAPPAAQAQSVTKAEPPGQGWVRGLEAVAKAQGGTVEDAMETVVGANTVAAYYKSAGDMLNAGRWAKRAEQIAARRALA